MHLQVTASHWTGVADASIIHTELHPLFQSGIFSCVVLSLEELSCSPWYDVEVTVLGLEVVSEDLPAQLNAPALAGRSLGDGAAPLGASDGQLGHLQHLHAHISTEQLEKQEEVG